MPKAGAAPTGNTKAKGMGAPGVPKAGAVALPAAKQGGAKTKGNGIPEVPQGGAEAPPAAKQGRANAKGNGTPELPKTRAKADPDATTLLVAKSKPAPKATGRVSVEGGDGSWTCVHCTKSNDSTVKCFSIREGVARCGKCNSLRIRLFREGVWSDAMALNDDEVAEFFENCSRT